MQLDLSEVVSRARKRAKGSGGKAQSVRYQEVRIGHRVITQSGKVEFEAMSGRTRVGFKEFDYEDVDD